MSKPYIITISLMSLDGKTSPPKEVVKLGPKVRRNYMLTILGEDAHEILVDVHRIRAESDGVLVGEQTVIDDDPELTVRVVEGKSPTRIVVSLAGIMDLHSKIFDTSKAPTIVALAKSASRERISELEGKGVRVLKYEEKAVNVKQLCQDLYQLGIKRLLMEGGATMRWLFFKEGLVDEYWTWVVPVFYGGTTTVGVLGGEGFMDPKEAVRLEQYERKTYHKVELNKYKVK